MMKEPPRRRCDGAALLSRRRRSRRGSLPEERFAGEAALTWIDALLTRAAALLQVGAHRSSARMEGLRARARSLAEGRHHRRQLLLRRRRAGEEHRKHQPDPDHDGTPRRTHSDLPVDDPHDHPRTLRPSAPHRKSSFAAARAEPLRPIDDVASGSASETVRTVNRQKHTDVIPRLDHDEPAAAPMSAEPRDLDRDAAGSGRGSVANTGLASADA